MSGTGNWTRTRSPILVLTGPGQRTLKKNQKKTKKQTISIHVWLHRVMNRHNTANETPLTEPDLRPGSSQLDTEREYYLSTTCACLVPPTGAPSGRRGIRSIAVFTLPPMLPLRQRVSNNNNARKTANVNTNSRVSSVRLQLQRQK